MNEGDVAVRSAIMRRALATIALASCTSAMPPVEFVPEDRKAPAMPARDSIEEYEIDCTPPVSANAPWEGSRLKIYVDAAQFYGERCFFHGGAFPWEVLGVFRVGADARDRWPEVCDAMRVRARAVGCDGIAFVRDGPYVFRDDQGPVGALCVGPRSAAAPGADDTLPGQGPCVDTKQCPAPFTCKNGRCE